MAGEVIDLISSSPPPEPRSKGKTKTAKPLPATRPAPHAVGDLDGFEDEFDTTGDIDGTASASQTCTTDRQSALRQSGVSGVEILSDDFQSTGDLAEPILLNSTESGNKRRRISPSPPLLISTHKVPRQTAPQFLDEFSDPFASSPPPSTNKILNRTDPFLQSLNASITGQSSLSSINIGKTISPDVASSPCAELEEDIRPLGSPEERSNQDGAIARQASAEPFKSSRVFMASEEGVRSTSAAKGKRPLTSGSRSGLGREVFPDPFASSPPWQESKQPKDDFQGAHGTTRRRLSPSKPGPMQLDTQRSSPDPFASSPEPTTKSSSKMTAVDIISSPPPESETANPARRQQWDPISSSAPEGNVISIASESDIGNESDDFPDLDNVVRNASQKPRSQLCRSRSDILPKAYAASNASTTREPGRTADEKARDKIRKDIDKEREKERKKQERERAKEAKLQEKERSAALAEVNKLKTDKKTSTPEMIVDVPSSLNEGTKAQLETLLKAVEADYTTWDTSDTVVKWRRKVTSKWNEEFGHWEPIPKRIMHEKHVAVVMTAQEFVDLTLDPEGGIRSHIMSMEEKFANSHIIYILEGMTPWMRKNRNLRNRQYTAGVRSEASSSGRRRAAAPEYVSEDLIEDALLELQVMHEVLIHHTAMPLETAQWITILTQHISTIPYKQQKASAQGAGFCMESGQVKTGEDNKDTYVKLLQEIARVTQPIAYGISIEFPSVTKLVNGLGEGGPTRLIDVKKTINREGALGDKKIGQAVSKRIHKVFTGRDEGSTDV